MSTLIMRILTRPLKAPTQPILDLASLQDRLPLWASDKEDGIRCLICPQRGAITGQMKPIPNLFVRKRLERISLHCLDGELVALDSEGKDCDFNDTQSVVMTRDGRYSFEFRVFDYFANIYDPYLERALHARETVEQWQRDGGEPVKWLKQTKITSIKQLEEVEADALKRGKEGIMLRHPGGWYKEGRSTLNEAYLLKVKRFTDDEAVVIGVEEEMENCNLVTLNERGLQTRSKHQSGMKPKGRVGKLLCIWRGMPIKIGSGLTNLQKSNWWIQPNMILRKTITFKYQVHGMKILPRAPIFKGIRYDA